MALRIASLNVRKLRDSFKLREVFNWLRTKDFAIYMLLCGSRKHPYPPPPTEDQWKFRGGEGGGVKGSNFQGVRGDHGKLFSKG